MHAGDAVSAPLARLFGCEIAGGRGIPSYFLLTLKNDNDKPVSLSAPGRRPQNILEQEAKSREEKRGGMEQRVRESRRNPAPSAKTKREGTGRRARGHVLGGWQEAAGNFHKPRGGKSGYLHGCERGVFLVNSKAIGHARPHPARRALRRLPGLRRGSNVLSNCTVIATLLPLHRAD